jgi:hypothetical protein
MKAYWENVIIPPSPGRFTSRERDPGTHWIRSCVGPQRRSGHGGEKKNPQPLPGFEPSIIQLLAQRYTTEISRVFP